MRKYSQLKCNGNNTNALSPLAIGMDVQFSDHIYQIFSNLNVCINLVQTAIKAIVWLYFSDSNVDFNQSPVISMAFFV